MSSLHTVDTLGMVIQTGCHRLHSPLTHENSAGEGISCITCSDDVQIGILPFVHAAELHPGFKIV